MPMATASREPMSPSSSRAARASSSWPARRPRTASPRRFPSYSSSVSETRAGHSWRPPSPSTCPHIGFTSAQRVPSRLERSTLLSCRHSQSAASSSTPPYPKPIYTNVVDAAVVVITMGVREKDTAFPGKHYEHWDVADPTGVPIETVRDIRDEIQNRVTQLIRDIVD